MSEDKKKRMKDKQEEQKNEKPKSANGDGGELEEDQPMVALTYDEFDALEKQIESLQTDVEDKQDQWLRALADFENYKKRVQRDATRTYQDAVVNVVKAYLPIADDLERALQNRPPDTESNNWFAGIELILQKLITLLKNQGIERMDVKPGDEFDPNVHEAITQEDHPDFVDGQIIEIVQPGYFMSDRIIRPAMVRVAR